MASKLIFLCACFVSVSGLATNVLARNDSTNHNIDWTDKTCKPLQLERKLISHPQVPASLQVENLSYLACDGKPLQAYLIASQTPPAKKSPAILYVHWLDPRSPNSNREEFVSEAVAFAEKGGVALLPATFWSIPGGYYMERRWQDDYPNTLNQIRDLKRALNILRAEKAVDSNHIAYVGHDYGAVFGAILAPQEPALKTWVLIAGAADISSWYTYGSGTGTPKGDDLQKFTESFAAIQPHVSLQKSKTPVLLQFAHKDEFLPDEQKQKLHSAAPKGSEFKLYDSDHAMALPQVRTDREQWLVKKLSL